MKIIFIALFLSILAGCSSGNFSDREAEDWLKQNKSNPESNGISTDSLPCP